MKTTLNIISVFVCFLLVGCAEEKKQAKTETAKKLPNIIYVLADDLGYGDIHAFNTNGKINTPHIDGLASEGMRFTDAHTSSSVCTPTRYGIITGRYNWRSPLKSSVLGGKSKALIPTSRTTVASLLKKAGYYTGFIGKWHLGWDWHLKTKDSLGSDAWNNESYGTIDFSKPLDNSPNDLGFDYAYGHAGSLDMAPYVYVENGKPTQVPDSTTVNTDKYSWWRKGPTAKDFVHDDVTPNFFRRSMKYIKERSEKDKPFFLYLALPSPHTPILPTKEWKGKSNLNPYGDFVMMVDDYMGRLLKVVKEAGIEENTLVIFTSDNGCSPEADYAVLAEKGHNPSAVFRGHKADIYEGGHRVPFIAKWPQKIAANTTSQKTICTTDLMATCADIVGLELTDDAGEDSFSMVPLFENSNASTYQRKATVHHSINGSFAIRQDSWKLIFCPGSGGWSAPLPNSKEIQNLPKYQLYNLHEDPGEQINLFGKHPAIEKKLKNLMLSYIENGRSTPGVAQANDDEGYGTKDWKQLKALIGDKG